MYLALHKALDDSNCDWYVQDGYQHLESVSPSPPPHPTPPHTAVFE